MKTSLSFVYIATLTLLLALVTPAQTPPPPPDTSIRPTPRATVQPGRKRPKRSPEKMAEMRAKMLARTGGFIEAPMTGKVILLLDTRQQADAAEIERHAAVIRPVLRINIVSAAIPGSDAIKTALANTNNAAVVAVVEDASQPALLIAPEERWAQVNIGALGGVEGKLLDSRLNKQLWRGLAYLLGGNSPDSGTLLQQIGSLEELDALTATALPLDAMSRILSQARELEVGTARRSTYRKAIEEGWAPAPTNDIQRGVWELVEKERAEGKL